MKNKSLTLVFSILISGFGIAQNTSGPLTITQAVQMGMSNSKQLKLDTIKIAQSTIQQAKINDAALPNVSLNAGYSRLSAIDPFMVQLPSSPGPVALFPVILNNYTTRASVNESVFNGWKLKYSMESYDYLNKAIQLDVDKDVADVKLNIMSAYISFVKLKLSEQIVAENIKASKKRVEEVSAQRDKGVATDNDVLKAQLYQSNLEISKSDIDNSIAIAQFNLDILLGLPQGTIIMTDTTGMFAAITLATESSYENDAFSKRSEKKASDYRLQANQSNVMAAKSVYYPSVGVGANYYFSRPNQRIIPFVDEFRNTWDVGINLSWNLTALYSGKHNVQDAQVQVMQTQMQTEMLNDNIRMEVFQNYMNCSNAINKISLLELTVKQAEENSRMTKARYDQQAALMSEVLDADAALLQARVTLILQRADAQLSYYKLQRATGNLN